MGCQLLIVGLNTGRWISKEILGRFTFLNTTKSMNPNSVGPGYAALLKLICA